MDKKLVPQFHSFSSHAILLLHLYLQYTYQYDLNLPLSLKIPISLVDQARLLFPKKLLKFVFQRKPYFLNAKTTQSVYIHQVQDPKKLSMNRCEIYEKVNRDQAYTKSIYV